MRTTLVIDDHLFLEMKKLAAERGCSLSLLMGEALSAFLSGRDRGSACQEFRVPVFEPNGTVQDSLPGDFHRLEDDEDLAPFSR